MIKEEKSVTPRRPKQLLSYDAKEVKKASDYSAKKETELKELTADVTDMGSLRLLWDSKVPEEKKSLFYFFKLSQSNKQEVLDEIKKYQDFYEELSKAMQRVSDDKNPCDASQKVSNEKGPSGRAQKSGKETEEAADEIIQPYEMIVEINKKLMEMIEAANEGKEVTDSSTIYKLHATFIAKHKKLENMIKGVECVALKQGLTKAIDGWKESKQSITRLENQLKINNENTNKKWDETNKKLEEVLAENKALREIILKYFQG